MITKKLPNNASQTDLGIGVGMKKPGEENDGKLKSLIGRFSVGKVVTHAAKLQTMNSYRFVESESGQ